MKEECVDMLYEQFNEKYGGYVCIDREIVMLFMTDVEPALHSVDNLYDYVLSNDLAYEIVE